MSDRIELVKIAAQIVSSYVNKNEVPFDQVCPLIQKTYDFLAQTTRISAPSIFQPINRSAFVDRPLTPIVAIEDSVKDDYIVCLEDGKKLQMLKRHLSTVYKMTPEQYKARWNLPDEYPIVSPQYARRRSEIAKTTKLGHSNRKKPKAANLGAISNVDLPTAISA